MKRFLFILVSGVILAHGVLAQELPFTHYTTDSGRISLPSAAVYKIYQDRPGYVWMAVFSSGLVRYDGTSPELYTVEDGLRDLDVWGVLEDSSGRLWVASNAGLTVSEEPLSAYEHGRRIRFTALFDSIPLLDERVSPHSVDASLDGMVWAGTARNGVVRYRSDADGNAGVDTFATPIETSLAATTENAPVLALAVRRDSSIWIAAENGGLLRMEPGRSVFTRAVDQVDLDGENVGVLHEDESGTLWAGTQEGRVLRIAGRPGDLTIEPVGPRLGAGVTSIAVSDDGTLWTATEGSGVLQGDLSAGSFRKVARANGLLSEIVHHVMQDDEGNIWFAQSGGVSKLRADYAAIENYSPRSHSGERPVLPASGVGSVLSSDLPDEPCLIWAATSEGGVACIDTHGTSDFLQEADGLRSNWVNAVHRDGSGRIWMGTIRGMNGVSFNGEPLPSFGAESNVELSGRIGRMRGYTSLTILSIASADISMDIGETHTTEAVWFAGIRHLIGLVENEWYVFSSASGLPPSVLNTVTTDGSGHLWIGTRDRGLYRSTEPLSAAALRAWQHDEIDIDGESFGRMITRPIFEQVWSAETGAPSNNVGPLLWMDDLLWVGTPNGLAVLDGDSAALSTLLTRRDGLGADNVTSMTFSPSSGTLWIGTNQGLAEVDPETREVVRTVTQDDGLIDNEVWMYGSVHAGSDGAIYYGTAKGLAIYRPDLDVPNRIPPRVHLRNVAFPRSDHSHFEASFEYSALSYANEMAVRYKTRLRGYDRDWSPETGDVKIRYTSLPAFLTARTYTLEVLARNEDGLWSQEPLAYSFAVPPPLRLRWWAFAVYLALFTAGALAFVRLHRSQVVKKEQEKVREREMELTAEAAVARSEAAEAQTRALEAENERKALELEKARELHEAYRELQQAHVHLKTTQAQLVQQEKLASLGQLTAGIAHEIKNPLNFVNNFAQLTDELAAELSEALSAGIDRGEVETIIGDLRLNTAKIREHGQRADGIVRGMMEHARGGDGKRERIQLNQLVDEYVSLAYHGMRSQLSDLSVDIARSYTDEDVEVEVAAQDIGRVLINLLTNALYAVRERSLRSNGSGGYVPRVSIETSRVDGGVEIRVADNGPGIPPKVQEKIFEPFFTTKPAGSGTGLGLSLAYEIIAHGHGGTLTLSSLEGEGAAFIVRLPLSNELVSPPLDS